MSEERTNSQLRFARVLSGIGSVWILLFLAANFLDVGGTPLGDVLAFFGGSFFIPVALLFAGRAIRRRSGQVARPDTTNEPQRSERRQAPPPPIFSEPEPVLEEFEPVLEEFEAPARSTPTTEGADVEDLAMAIGFEEPSSPEPDTDRELGATDQFKADHELSYKSKSSQEMIAEARDRLKRKD